MDATALTWDCPKPTDLIRITPIISLSLCPYFPPLTPLPSSSPAHTFAVFLSPAALSPAQVSPLHHEPTA